MARSSTLMITKCSTVRSYALIVSTTAHQSAITAVKESGTMIRTVMKTQLCAATVTSIMKNALKRVGLYKFACERIDTDEGNILCIDRNGEITRSEFDVKSHSSKYLSWFDDEPYYSAHEEMLLAYCGCYGVDSSDVEILLEYGYTCDEIEDMLVDTNLLQETLNEVKGLYGEEIYENCCGAF